MDLNFIDVVFTLVLIILTLRAAFRGFIREFMSVAALVLGVGGAALGAGIAALWLEQILGPSMWNHVIAFLGLFLLLYLSVKLTEGALDALVERIHLDSLDHALGLFFGGGEGLLAVFLIILLLQIQPLLELDSLMTGSIYVELLTPLLPYANTFLQ